MAKSNIKSLSRLSIIKLIAARLGTIGKSSDEPARDLYDYLPNKIAKALHPNCQHLVVKEIVEYGKDMKSFVFGPDKEAGTEKLAWFEAGQYLSIHLEFDGQVLNRPYSISSSPRDTLDDKIMLTIKRVGGGLASQYMLDNVKVGDKILASAPLGDFTYQRLRDAGTVIGIAGGSGITPFRDFAKAIYEGDEDFDLVLLYGSRTLADAVFSDEISAWAKECPKIKLVNVLSNETVEGCESGFITADLIKKYAPEGDYSIFLCGPQAMYDFADKEIEKLGIRQKFVRHELFGEYFHPEKNADYAGDAEKEYTVTVHIDGEVKKVPCKGSTSLLRAMEAAGLSVPSDCRSGRCGWCRSQLLSGEVYVPESVDGRRLADKEFGYVHPCCSFPLTDVEIDVPVQKK
ncbi:MAG: iron-sulfur cluster-binding domain-containing protein [Clostridia bacterium]|nr:iron-sulfur cluster-binding domain-containing protein [Clostridia bacterium]